MLRDARPSAPRYDEAHDTLELTFSADDAGAGAPALPGPKEVRVTLLLDRDGALVGVDARDAFHGAPVLLLGAHEDVARTDEVKASLSRTDATFVLRIAEARARARAHLPNPYATRTP